jgi:hypothetical protein
LCRTAAAPQRSVAADLQGPLKPTLSGHYDRDRIEQKKNKRQRFRHMDKRAEDAMDLQARVEFWKSIDPNPEFCRRAEREMLMLSSSDTEWIAARMRDFEQVLGTEPAE